jgi:hypothetical protein
MAFCKARREAAEAGAWAEAIGDIIARNKAEAVSRLGRMRNRIANRLELRRKSSGDGVRPDGDPG